MDKERSWKNLPNGCRWTLLAAVIIQICLSTGSKPAAAGDPRNETDCDIHHAPCTKPLLGSFVTLDILPKPVKAMKELTFKVTLPERKSGPSPFIDLGMPGMKMGPNRVMLKPEGPGEYLGTGIIVRCPSGRRVWKATVTVPGSGVVEFTFDVIY